MTKIILDVDTGSDDAIAILAALFSNDIDLLGITTVAGNKELPLTTENTLKVVELSGKQVPVYAGCATALVADLLPHRRSPGDGMTGVGEVTDEDGKLLEYHTDRLELPEPVIKPEERHAVNYLIDTLMKSGGDITVVTVGPMTNLAMAIRMEPRIVEKIHRLVFMGGGIRVTNSTSAAEFNIWFDPEAAQIVLTSGIKDILMVPLDATHQANFTRDDCRELESYGTPAPRFVAGLIEQRIKAHIAFQPQKILDSAPIHDALAVAAIIDESLLTDIRHMRVDVDMGGGFADGQTICDPRTFPDREKNVRVAHGAHRKRFATLLKELLKQG